MPRNNRSICGIQARIQEHAHDECAKPLIIHNCPSVPEPRIYLWPRKPYGANIVTEAAGDSFNLLGHSFLGTSVLERECATTILFPDSRDSEQILQIFSFLKNLCQLPLLAVQLLFSCVLDGSEFRWLCETTNLLFWRICQKIFNRRDNGEDGG